MAQTIVECPLRDLSLVGTPTPGYEPTIVGGVDALASDDGDGSYVEWGGEPGAPSGAYLDGSFDAAAIPDGHIVTGMFLAVKMRQSGSSGYSTIDSGIFDSAQFPDRDTAASEGWLWTNFLDADDGTSYAFTGPRYEDYPELGFEVFEDARDWAGAQTDAYGDEFSFTLDDLRAGTVKCALWVPGFYSAPPGTYQSRITAVKLYVRHAPLPVVDIFWPAPSPFTGFVPVPDLEDLEVGYGGLGDYVNLSENQDRSAGVGGYPSGWVQSALDTYWAEIIRDTPPGGAGIGSTGLGNGIYNSFVYMLVSNSGPYANFQNRNCANKVCLYPTHRFVNNGNDSSPVWQHQRATLGAANDPYDDYAGLVQTTDGLIEWDDDYRLRCEKLEVKLRAQMMSTFEPLVAELSTYPDNPPRDVGASTSGPLSAWVSAGVDTRATPGETVYQDHYSTLPSHAGSESLPLLDSGTLDPGGTGLYESPDWIDVTADKVLDEHDVDTWWFWWGQADQHSGSAFGFGSPGNEGLDGSAEKSYNADVLMRVTLGFPDRRFEYLSLDPLNQAGGRAWIRQRQVGALAQRRQAQGSPLAQRQPRWR